MATSFAFGNRIIKTPGSYSRILSGVRNTAAGLDYGALLVIDTNSMAGWGGGSGINGEDSQGKGAIYSFDNIQDARNFVKGGLWYDLIPSLFRPSELGIPGISSISFVRAASTTGATISYTFVGGGSNGGSISFKLKEEGIGGNGVLNGTSLKKGFAARMVAGTIDPTKFKIQFYLGTFRGLDYANEPIGGISEVSSKEVLIAESIEFNNISELGSWANSDSNLNNFFKTTFTVAGTGLINSADLSANSSYKLAIGGTETYNSTHLNDALEVIKDEVFDFILADRWGSDATDVENLTIIANVVEQMAIKPDVYIGAYNNKTDFNSSLGVASTLNSDVATVVHGGIKVALRSGAGFKNSPSIYLAAQLLGREAGLPPQVPLTFKGITIQGLTHQLSEKDLIQSLDGGLLVVKNINNSFDVVKGINSLQNNKNLLNEDGSSPSKQIKRIIRQLNKELVSLSRSQLLKSQFGVNRNTLSEEDLKNWVESYLLSRTATPLEDNLILSFENVTVTRNQDAYFVGYGVTLNTEVSFLFFTGTVISI